MIITPGWQPAKSRLQIWRTARIEQEEEVTLFGLKALVKILGVSASKY
jgi:UDP-N-acetylmuramoylalanine-D-glutamate ligase